jgi:flagella basal body P-ring formation protein FlgA
MKNFTLRTNLLNKLQTWCSIVIGMCLSSLFASNCVHAGIENTLHKQLQHNAEAYVLSEVSLSDSSEIGVVASRIDPRIKVPVCDLPFEFDASDEALAQSNVTLRASCPSQPNWYLYMVVKVQRIQPVVVLSQAASPGTVLTQDMLKIVEMDKQQIRNTTYSASETLIGSKLKRRIRPGQPVTPNVICFVCKGDSVVINAVSTGLQIKTKGIAQQDGNIGEQILVQNRSSKKMLRAVVSDQAQVKVRI